MNNRDIEWRRRKLEEIRNGLESSQLNAVRELISKEVIERICEEDNYYFRSRLLTPVVTLFQMIQAGIHREGSFQSAWQMSGQSGQSGSLAKARKRLPLGVWKRLHEWMMVEIDSHGRREDVWRGHRMVGVDGTCLSMADEPALAEVFGRCSTGNGGDSRFPFARLVLAFNLKTLVAMGHGVGGYRTSEQALLRKLWMDFKPGDVLIADRQFAGANLYGEYRQRGFEFISRPPATLQIERLKVEEAFAADDWITRMKIWPEHRKKNAALPESIQVRMIRMTMKQEGKREDFWLVTSLLDRKQYPADEIRQWYRRRWKVETLIEELKIWLGADILRSKTPEGIYKELYARLVGMNLIHWLILKATQKHNQEADRVSVSAALRLTVAYSLKMSTAPLWQLPYLYEELLEHIRASVVPYRPYRLEPRMQKREHRNFPKLKISRSEWRVIHGNLVA